MLVIRIEKLEEKLNKPIHQPHKCPVCDGKGLKTAPEIAFTMACHVCKGNGIIFG